MAYESVLLEIYMHRPELRGSFERFGYTGRGLWSLTSAFFYHPYGIILDQPSLQNLKNLWVSLE